MEASTAFSMGGVPDPIFSRPNIKEKIAVWLRETTVREPHEDVAHTQSGVRGCAVRDRSRGLVREEEDTRGRAAETQDYRNTRSRSAPREVTHEVDNEGSRRPGKRGRSSSTAGRSTRSTNRTAHSMSLTEADIPRIADAVTQAISTRSRESPHGDGNPDSADTENDTDGFAPSDTMETGKMYYNQ